LGISVFNNKSFFYSKTSRIYFQTHRLPNQSLLKLGGKKVTGQFAPCVRRAHQSGAIFPLTCARQRLFSIDYHHEGGARHWYIIPPSERNIIQKLLDQQKCSFCLDHGELLIDPSVLDKHNIRYYRLIQRPNQFVVLSAGTLSQSFTEDQTWNESIDFALPSWIEEGHANAPSCQCNSLPSTIDVNLFRHELIQSYISTHLHIVNDDKLLPLKG